MSLFVVFTSLGICIASQTHVIDRQTQSARFTLLGQTLLLGNCAWSQLVTYCNILQYVCDSHYIIFVLILLYVIYVRYIVVSHGLWCKEHAGWSMHGGCAVHLHATGVSNYRVLLTTIHMQCCLFFQHTCRKTCSWHCASCMSPHLYLWGASGRDNDSIGAWQILTAVVEYVL